MKATTLKKAALVAGSLGLLSGAAFSQGTAVSGAGGYYTTTLSAGQFNLIGLSLHEPIDAAGSFETIGASSLTDNDIDFGATLTAGETYILKATSGAANGLVDEIPYDTAVSGNTLTTTEDYAAAGLTDTDTYTLRRAKKLSDIFGPNNEAGLQGDGGTFNPNAADNILIPSSTTPGTFDVYFYGEFAGLEGYKNNLGAAVDPAIVYTDAFYVRRRAATDLDLVVTGMVDTDDTSISAEETFNYIGNPYPVGVTLGNSGLAVPPLQGDGGTFNPNAADNVLIPSTTSPGTFDVFFFSEFAGLEGWKTNLGADATAQELPSGYIIQKRGPDFDGLLTPPGFYATL